MEELKENKLTKFTFYDLYYKALKDKPDEYAGRLIKNICKVIFDNGQIDLPENPIEQFEWHNLCLTLDISKSLERQGKKSKVFNKQMKHFTFYEDYYKAIRLLNDKQSGQYIKAICGYMLDDAEPKGLDPVVEKYFNYAKWNLTLSRVRSMTGRKSEKVATASSTVTLEDIQSEFNLKGEIYNREKYLQGIDLCDVREYFKVNPPSPEKSIYYAWEEYKKVKKNGT